MVRTGVESRTRCATGPETTREVADAFALNRARSLAMEQEFCAPYPPIVAWARARAKVLDEGEDVDRDKPSAFGVEISVRPAEDIVKECAKSIAYS